MSARNHEVTTKQQLLDVNGNIAEPGWSRCQLQQYSREHIKVPKFRIKEWDYYLVVGDDCAVAFTLSDDGYVGLQSVSLLDFSGKPWEHTETVLDAFPMGKLKMPTNSSEGDIVYEILSAYLITSIRASHSPVTSGCSSPKWIRWSLQHRGIKREDSIITRKSIVCAQKVLQNIMESGTNFTRKNISERSTGDEVCGHMITLGTGVPGTAM